MASWPLARYVDFFSRSTPRISAVFLNSIQDVVVGLFSGTLSLAGLTVDSTGGAAISATPGWVIARVLQLLQAAPLTAVTEGTLYRDLVPFGLVVFDGSGPTIIQRVNVDTTISKIGGAVGSYRITMLKCPARFAAQPDGTTVYPAVLVTTQGTAQAARVEAHKETVGGAAVLVVDVYIAADSYLAVLIYP